MFAACGSSDDTASSESSEVVESTEEQSVESTEETSEESVVETTDLVSADPLERIVDSYYSFSYPIEGMDDMVQFFHFYGDDLGIGSVFYVSYAWNQITYSGTYTVEETEYAYEVMETQNGEVVAGTTPYTITFYNWDGEEIDKAGYDGEYVYNMTTAINSDGMTGGGQYKMPYVTDEIMAKYQNTFEGELGTAYIKFVSPEDASATLDLNTNGTYSDMVIMAVDGNWTKEAEGSYTLTPKSESDNGATVVLQEDGSYLYTSADGTEMVLNQDTAALAGYIFKGTIQVQGMDADLVLTTYDDGTCTVVASLSGMELEVDAGTYVVAEDGFTYTFTLNNAGEVVSELGGDTGVQVHYVQTGNEAVGDVDAMLAIQF